MTIFSELERCYPGIHLKKLRKTTKTSVRVVLVLAKI
jgi:hypothetical protein